MLRFIILNAQYMVEISLLKGFEDASDPRTAS